MKKYGTKGNWISVVGTGRMLNLSGSDGFEKLSEVKDEIDSLVIQANLAADAVAALRRMYPCNCPPGMGCGHGPGDAELEAILARAAELEKNNAR